MSKHIVIVGCSGFVGHHLTEALLQHTHWLITGFDLEVGKISHLLQHPRLQFHSGDAYCHPELDKAIEQAHVVISLAALCNPSLYNTEPLRVIESNYFGPARLVEKCAKLKKWLIQFSTSEVYGKTILSQWPKASFTQPPIAQIPEQSWLLNEDTTPLIMGPVQQQRWSYASAKQLLERTVLAYHLEQDLRYTLIRPFNFLGLGMDFLPGIEGEGLPRVLANFTANLLCGKPLSLVDGGKSKRTFLCVKEATDAVINIIQNPETCQNQIFNLGNPKNEVTIETFAGLIKKAFAQVSGDDEWNAHPVQSVSSAIFYGPGYEDSDRRLPDISKAMLRFGFNPARNLDSILSEVAQYNLSLYPSSPNKSLCPSPLAIP